jgi:hypothetical protein
VGFSKPDMTVNILSSSSVAYKRVFTFITGLQKHDKSSLYQVSVTICIISKCLRRSSFKCMFKYLKNYEINKFKIHNRSYGKY